MSNDSSDKGSLEQIRGALTSGSQSQSALGGRSESGTNAGRLGTSVFTVSTAVLLENAQEPEGRGSGIGDPPFSSGSGSSLSAFRLSLDSEQVNSSETLLENSVGAGGSDGSANEVNIGALGVIKDEEKSDGGEQSVGKGKGGRFGFVGCFSRRAAVDVLPESQVNRISGAVVIDLNVLGIGEFGDGERVEPGRDDIGTGAWGDVDLGNKVGGEVLNKKIVDDVLGEAEGYGDEDSDTLDGSKRDVEAFGNEDGGGGNLEGRGRNVEALRGGNGSSDSIGIGNKNGILGGGSSLGAGGKEGGVGKCGDGGGGSLGAGDRVGGSLEADDRGGDSVQAGVGGEALKGGVGGGGSLGYGERRTHSLGGKEGDRRFLGRWEGVGGDGRGGARLGFSLDGEHLTNRTLRRSNRSLELGGWECDWDDQHGGEIIRGGVEGEADGINGDTESENHGDANLEEVGSKGFGCGNFGYFGIRNRMTVSQAIPVVQRVAGHVIIDMTGVEDDIQVLKPSKCLKLQYNLMYILGLSRYTTWKEMGTKDWFWFILDFLQCALFWFWTVNSLFHSIRQGKFNFFYFLSEASYSKFVQFVFYIVILVGKLYGVNLFAFRKEKTDKMMTSIEEFENKYSSDYEIKGRAWKWMLVGILPILTLISAVTAATFATGFFNWSMEHLLLTNSEILGEDLFIWRTKNVVNITLEIDNAYGQNLTATTITFGWVMFFSALASFLQIGIMLDIAITIAYVMYLLFKPFIKEVKAVTENVPYENVMEWDNLQRRREKLYVKYREAKLVAKDINLVYNPVLKLMHIGNMLMYVVFLVFFIFSENTSGIIILVYAYNTVKAELSYFIAGQIAEQNDAIRAWMRNWAMYTGKIRVGDKEIDVIVILDELTKDPIGLGQGSSLIQHTLHFKLLGLVFSVFFSVADDYKVSP